MSYDPDDPPPKLSLELFSDLGLDIDEPLATFSQQQQQRQRPPSSGVSRVAEPASKQISSQGTSKQHTTTAAFKWDGFDQVKSFQDHNSQLLKKVDEQSIEIARLQTLLEESSRSQQASEYNAAPVADASQKIYQLSKKLRELTANLSAEQSRTKKGAETIAQLEGNIATLHDEIDRFKRKEKKLETRIARLTDPSLQGDADTAKGDAKSTAKPDTATTEKPDVIAFRNQIQSLKKELQLTQKALVREIGEEVNVAHVLSSESTWKGRADQIMFLKQKLAEAQVQLAQDTSLDTSLRSAATFTTSASKNTESKQRAELKKVETERRIAAEKTAQELLATLAENGNLRQKMDGLKARNHALSQENKDIKEKLETALARHKRDDDMLEQCTKQIAQLKHETRTSRAADASLSEEKRRLEEVCAAQHEAITQLQQQLEELERQRKTQRRQQEKELERLTEELHAAQFQMSEEQHLMQMQLQQQQSLQRQLQVKLQEQLEHQTIQPAETSSVSLPPIKPPSRAAASKPTTSSSVRASSAASKRLETYSAHVHRDCEIKLNEVTSQYRSADAEKTKQGELIQLLKRQLSECQTQLESLDSQLRAQKRFSMPLEKDLSTFTSKTAEQVLPAQLHELESRLAIQEDENQALKESTKAAMRRKDEEIAILNSMLTEIKRVYGDSIKSFKLAIASMQEGAGGNNVSRPVNAQHSFAPRPPSNPRNPAK